MMERYFGRTCAHCAHFDDDAESFEKTFPGILALSSGGGDTKGDQGICNFHQQMVNPHLSCADFHKKSLVK